MEKTGAEILIESLIEEGVDTLFGIPGGTLISIFDSLYNYSDKIKYYLTRHEQAAAHAADGYARATGKVGVCIATSGPGATNLVTGIANAYLDSIPMVAITGQVATKLIGNDAFQEVNITGITYSITKHNYLVKDAKDMARIIKEAFYIANTGRPGPVLIDIPSDISKQIVKDYVKVKEADIRSYKPVYTGNIKQIQKAAELISEAKKPLIYAGGGVIISNAEKELREFVEKTGIPVTMTLLGLGGLPTAHPLSLDMLGMHGTRYANIAMTETDLIIAIGSRFDDRVTGKLDEFAPNAKVIHIDIDPSSISKSVQVDVPIVGDVKNVLKQLIKYVKKCDIKDWVNYVTELKRKYPLKYEDTDKVIKPQYIIEQISNITKGDAYIVTEVGQHQMWAAQFYKYTKPRSIITSGGLGTMGYGFPAAIGVQVAKPDATVIDIAGDGSIQMNIQELATIRSYDLPVKIIILNNMFLGMVRQWQELFFGKRYSATYLGMPKNKKPAFGMYDETDRKAVPDFKRVAEAYGIKGYIIDKKSDVTPILEEALKSREPAVLDFRIDVEENVFPMVPAGAPLNRMLEHPLA